MQPALLAADADEYSVTRSLEAYLLWLFGYIMFNNTHGNSVDRILLPYAREIADGDEDVPPYSWGEAVLAATYRGLCDGCMKTWERYPVRVPTNATALVVREASRWSALCQPRALPRGHVRRRGGREAHYGNYLDLASVTFVSNLILLFIVT